MEENHKVDGLEVNVSYNTDSKAVDRVLEDWSKIIKRSNTLARKLTENTAIINDVLGSTGPSTENFIKRINELMKPMKELSTSSKTVADSFGSFYDTLASTDGGTIDLTPELYKLSDSIVHFNDSITPSLITNTGSLVERLKPLSSKLEPFFEKRGTTIFGKLSNDINRFSKTIKEQMTSLDSLGGAESEGFSQFDITLETAIANVKNFEEKFNSIDIKPMTGLGDTAKEIKKFINTMKGVEKPTDELMDTMKRAAQSMKLVHETLKGYEFTPLQDVDQITQAIKPMRQFLGLLKKLASDASDGENGISGATKQLTDFKAVTDNITPAIRGISEAFNGLKFNPEITQNLQTFGSTLTVLNRFSNTMQKISTQNPDVVNSFRQLAQAIREFDRLLPDPTKIAAIGQGISQLAGRTNTLRSSINNLNKVNKKSKSNSFFSPSNLKKSYGNLTKIAGKIPILGTRLKAIMKLQNVFNGNGLTGFNKGINNANNGFFNMRNLVLGVASALATLQIGRFAKEALDAGAAVERVGVLMENTFKENNEMMSSFAEKYATAFNLDLVGMKQSMAILGNSFLALNMDVEHSLTMTKSLVLLAEDIALSVGRSVEDARLAIQSGMRGETESIQDFGIQLEVANVQLALHAMGIDVNWQKMNELEKKYARYLTIMHTSVNQQGIYGKMLDTTTGKLRALEASYKSMMQNLGALFEPVFKFMLDGLIKIIQFANMAVQSLQKLFPKKKVEADGLIADPADAKKSAEGLEEVEEGLEDVEEAAKKANKQVASFDELITLTKPDTKKEEKGDSLGIGLDWLPDKLPELDWAEFFGKNQNFDYLRGMAEDFAKSLHSMFSALKLAGSTMWEGIKTGFNSTMPKLTAEMELASNNWTMMWNRFANATQTDRFKLFSEALGRLGGELTNLALVVFNSFVVPMLDHLGILDLEFLPTLTGILDGVSDFVVKTAEWFKMDSTQENFKKFATFIGDTVRGIIAVGKNIWNGIKEGWDKVAPEVVPKIKQFFEDAKAGVEKVIEVMKSPEFKKFAARITETIGVLATFALTIYNDVLVPIISAIFDLFVELLPYITQAQEYFNDFVRYISDLVSTVGNLIANLIRALSKIVIGVFDIISGILSLDLPKVGRGIVKILEGIVETLASLMAGILNLFIDLINRFIRTLNRIKIPDHEWIPEKFRGKGIDIPLVPKANLKLEKGGLVTKNVIAEVGEKGKKEGVIPLESPQALSLIGQAIAEYMPNSQGKTEVHNHYEIKIENAYGDAESMRNLAEALLRELQLQQQRIGGTGYGINI